MSVKGVRIEWKITREVVRIIYRKGDYSLDREGDRESGEKRMDFGYILE